jgi:hypothetical protein
MADNISSNDSQHDIHSRSWSLLGFLICITWLTNLRPILYTQKARRLGFLNLCLRRESLLNDVTISIFAIPNNNMMGMVF